MGALALRGWQPTPQPHGFEGLGSLLEHPKAADLWLRFLDPGGDEEEVSAV